MSARAKARIRRRNQSEAGRTHAFKAIDHDLWEYSEIGCLSVEAPPFLVYRSIIENKRGTPAPHVRLIDDQVTWEICILLIVMEGRFSFRTRLSRWVGLSS